MNSPWEIDFPSEGQPLLFPELDESVNVDPPPAAQVEFLNLKDDQLFEKVQSRKGGWAKQVVENGLIEMKATYGPYDLLTIRGWVRRDPEAAKLCNDNNEAVLFRDSVTGEELNLVETTDLRIESDEPRRLSQLFSVDLGKLYEGPKQPVFKLAKTDTLARNRFQVIIQLEFPFDQFSEYFVSPTFVCRTKPKRKLSKAGTVDSGPSTPKHTLTEPPSVDSGTADLSYAFSLPHDTSLSPSPFSISNFENNVIVENLEARRATIDDLVVRNSWKTPNADIAYHLRIKDNEVASELEEGDIVGFFTNQNDGGTEIKRLVDSDIESAVHAGVVSRSYYLAANTPMGDDKTEPLTDTVCVIGIVNVKVIGSVEHGERIYASVSYPGKAIPQSHLPIGSFLRKKHVLLGMALEKKPAKSLEVPHLVKCFVCIVLDVNRKEVLDEIEKLYESTEESTKLHIRAAQKKTWRRLKCCFFISLTFLILLSVLLYQLLVPGSMLRYWLCRQGAIPGHDVRFTFIPLRDHTREYHVHGLRFSFQKMLDKISEYGIDKNEKTGGPVYYYVNLDRCAFSGDYGELGNTIGGHKSVGGGKILSADTDCSTVYWYGLNGSIGGYGWYRYKSAKRLRCSPPR